MGASSDAKEEIGMSCKGEAYSNGVEMDTDDDEILKSTSIHELGEKFLKLFCKKAAVSFSNPMPDSWKLNEIFETNIVIATLSCFGYRLKRVDNFLFRAIS